MDSEKVGNIFDEDEENLVRRGAENKTDEERRSAVEGKHKTRLNSLGISYLGISSPHIIKKDRITRCYACKKDLDNTIDIECKACGWIICSCGACGCGLETKREI